MKKYILKKTDPVDVQPPQEHNDKEMIKAEETINGLEDFS